VTTPISVVFTGPRLDQADLDVWEQCIHIARTSALGNTIQFSAHGFLKAIGRNTGLSQHEWLKGAFARLQRPHISSLCPLRGCWRCACSDFMGQSAGAHGVSSLLRLYMYALFWAHRTPIFYALL